MALDSLAAVGGEPSEPEMRQPNVAPLQPSLLTSTWSPNGYLVNIV